MMEYDGRAHAMDFDTDRYTDQPLPKSTRPTRIIGAGVLFFSILVAASLVSYNHQEMGWAYLNPQTYETAAEAPCTNWLSVPGLYLAGLLRAFLGGGAIYAALLTAFVSGGMLFYPQTPRLRQWVSALCMVLFACAFLDIQKWILQGWVQANNLKSAGGSLGYLLGTCIFAALLGAVWAGVITVVSHAVALVVFSRVSAKRLAEQAWADTKTISRAIARTARYIWYKIRRTPAPVQESEDGFEEQETDWKQDYNNRPQAPQPQQVAQKPTQQQLPLPRPATTLPPRQSSTLPPRQTPRPLPPTPEPQPARTQQQPQDFSVPKQPTIQTGPPPLRAYEPEPARSPEPQPAVTPRPRTEDPRPLSLEEQLAEADKRRAAAVQVQAPPTGRARRPQTHQNSADNLLDLMRPIEETIERRNAPDTERPAQQAPHRENLVNPRVLNAMNRRLGHQEEEDEEDVPPPPQVPARRAAVAPQRPVAEPAPQPMQRPVPAPTVSARVAPRPLPQDTRAMSDDYPLPSYELLNYVPVAEEDTEAAETEMRETQQCIMDALETFKIQVEPGDITRGPSITRYEFYPPKGLRLNKITNLADNLKLAAQAKSINILAPIPGKNTIGIELENATKAPVFLRELLQSEAFHSKKLRIPVALGKDVYGNPVIGDLAAMPHTLVAGTTGSGKSVCVNSMILSMLYKFRPDELKLILVDPKVVEMQPYKKLPHLACPVVTVASRVIGALRWAVNEMEHRYKLFSKMGVRNFEDFNNRPEDYVPEPDEDELAEQYDPLPEGYDAADAIVRDIENSQGIEDMEEEEQGEFDFDQDEEIPAKLPYIVIIIDELADLMMQVKEDLENYIARLTQKARAAGIHLVAATQTPRANVITGIIKANIPSRLAFKVASPLDSRVILDTNGAENLLGKGDFLFLPPGGITKMTRAQGAFVSDPEIASIVKFCAAHAKQNFVQGVTAEMNNADSASGGGDGGGRLGGNGMSDEDAELYTRCVQLVITERKASTSLLQRRFSIGYGRAAKIMDMMEKRGVIGPASGNTSRPREVLIDAP